MAVFILAKDKDDADAYAKAQKLRDDDVVFLASTAKAKTIRPSYDKLVVLASARQHKFYDQIAKEVAERGFAI